VADARPAWKILRVLGNALGLEGFGYQSSEEVRDELRGRCASVDAKVPDIRPRTVSLAHEGVIVEGTMYSGDGLVRRSRPLQETREGRTPPRVWT
jgi:NADH-quinone oxidoreductase subunit G